MSFSHAEGAAARGARSTGSRTGIHLHGRPLTCRQEDLAGKVENRHLPHTRPESERPVSIDALVAYIGRETVCRIVTDRSCRASASLPGTKQFVGPSKTPSASWGALVRAREEGVDIGRAGRHGRPSRHTLTTRHCCSDTGEQAGGENDSATTASLIQYSWNH